MAAAFGVGNIIGPQTFQVRDAPSYLPAKITVLATQGVAAVLAVVLFAYYVWSNRRRGRSQVEPDATEWRDLTDKENKSLRYTY